jgi:hypothetical protein
MDQFVLFYKALPFCESNHIDIINRSELGNSLGQWLEIAPMGRQQHNVPETVPR